VLTFRTQIPDKCMQKQSNSMIGDSAKRLRRMVGLMRPTGKVGLQPRAISQADRNLFAHAYPSLQFAGSPEQADARPLKFEIRVLQCVITLVGLTAGIVQFVQRRAA
jgi:hypothetical protein